MTDKTMWDVWLSLFELPSVSAADELGLFRALAESPLEETQLAKILNISPQALRSLSRVLSILGFLKVTKKRIALTKLAQEYLLPSSPQYWGPVLEGTRSRTEHKRVLEALTRDGFHLSYSGKTYTEMWETGNITAEAARAFTARMHSMIFAPIKGAVASGIFSKTKRILDVGGGSGAFSIALAQKKPKVQSTIFDLPQVCEVARDFVSRSGSGQNISYFPGNFFKDEWPKNYDGVFFSNIFHDWQPAVCRQLAERALAALKPGGHIFIHEMILDKSDRGELAPALFDLLMFMNHTAQQWSKADLFELLKNAGFIKAKIHKTFGYYSVVVAQKPR